jgi:trimethylamine:corrinoid methyltransferase-like protein
MGSQKLVDHLDDASTESVRRSRQRGRDADRSSRSTAASEFAIWRPLRQLDHRTILRSSDLESFEDELMDRCASEIAATETPEELE